MRLCRFSQSGESRAAYYFDRYVVPVEAALRIYKETPSGVGNATGTFLKPGDRVEAEIEGIGMLRNQIVAAP